MSSIDDLRNEQGGIDAENIGKIIPYKYPFLFVDKVLSLDKKKIVAIKKVRKDEPYLPGHFVNFPIMPGALIVEGLGQAGTLIVRYNIPNQETKDILAYKIKKAIFKYPTFPGQELKYVVELKKMNDKGAILKGTVHIDNDPRASAEVKMTLAIVDREPFRNKFKDKAVLE